MSIKKPISILNQVGGHETRFIFNSDGTMLKKLSTFQHEKYNYFEIFQNHDDDDEENQETIKEHQSFQKFLPNFYGIEIRNGYEHLKLENLLFNLSHPCIMDVKMNTETITLFKFREPNMDPEKIRRNLIKDVNTTTKEYGFRIVGYIIRNHQGEIIERKVKDQDSMKYQNSILIFKKFLTSADGRIHEETLKFYINRIDEMIYHFENFGRRKIVGSSLLFLHSGDFKRYNLKIIDPASWEQLERGKRDEGYLKGLRSLKLIFTRLQSFR
jgi:nucleoside diphosphate kinase